MPTFDTPGPVRLRVSLSAGDIQITALPTDQSTVELTADRDDEVSRDLIAQTRIEHRDGELSVLAPRHFRVFFGRKPQLRLEVTVPTGSDLDLRTESADVEALGEYGRVAVQAGSGDLRLATVNLDARLQSGSGDVEIEQVEGALRAETGSGDVQVGAVGEDASISTGSGDIELATVAGDAVVNSGSGDIELHDVRGNVTANTASGDLQLLRVRGSRVRANTASGDVHVGVADGIAAWLDVNTITGDLHCDLDGADEPAEHEDTVRLQVNTASGDITLVHA